MSSSQSKPADAIVRRGTAELPEDQIARRVELRRNRQAVLEREPTPLRLWGVLDEAVLRRVVGSPRIMNEQLNRLAELGEYARVTLQVLPFRDGAHPGMQGSFTLLDFPWAGDPGVVYIEHRSSALYLEESLEIEAHTVAFQHLCAQALPPGESVAMIRAVAKEYSP